MAESIMFRGSSIRYFDLRQGKEGGDVFCRIHMSSTWNEQVRDKMEWEPVPDSVTECKLAGELLASHLVLTPGDKQLKQFELQFEISSVEDFRLVPLKDDEGDICVRQLRFVVRTPVAAEGFLGQYVRTVGRHEGALKISYVKQEELPLEESAPTVKANEADAGEDNDTGCISCNNSLGFESPGMHVNGVRCSREGSTLASARQASGGTHARKRRESAEAQVN